MFVPFREKPVNTLIDLFLIEREPTTRQVIVGGTKVIKKKLKAAFPGPQLPSPMNQAIYLFTKSYCK